MNARFDPTSAQTPSDRAYGRALSAREQQPTLPADHYRTVIETLSSASWSAPIADELRKIAGDK